MEIFIITSFITVFGVYLYFRHVNRIFRRDNHGRRSGFDRRKALLDQRTDYRDPERPAGSLQKGAWSPGMHEMRGESVKVSVEDRGNYIQISKPGIFDSSCKIRFRSEDVDILNHWLMEAKSKAMMTSNQHSHARDPSKRNSTTPAKVSPS